MSDSQVFDIISIIIFHFNYFLSYVEFMPLTIILSLRHLVPAVGGHRSRGRSCWPDFPSYVRLYCSSQWILYTVALTPDTSSGTHGGFPLPIFGPIIKLIFDAGGMPGPTDPITSRQSL
jgi:hypothetical protein